MTHAQRTISRRRLMQGMAGVLGAGFVGPLAACGNSNGSSAAATTISAWIYRPEFRKAIESILDAFSEDHPDIAVAMEYKPAAEYPTLIQTELVGGAGPDAMATTSTSGIWGDLGAGGGYILPLDDHVPVDALTPSVQEAITFDDHVYGSPVQTFRVGVYYQKAAFEEHGLEPPRTWDDLFDISETLLAAGLTPWSMPAQDFIIPYFFYHLAVNSILGAEGSADLRKGTRKLTDPDLVSAAQLLADMSPYFDSGFLAVPYTEGKALFAREQAAMMVGGTSDYAGYEEINPELNIGFFGFPSPEGDSEPQVVSGLSMAYTVNKRTEHPEETITFVAWLAGERAQQLIADQLGAPSRTGITPSGDDSRAVMVRQTMELPESPSWQDHPATVDLGTALRKGSGLLSGRLSAQELAETGQAAIEPES